MVRNTKAKIRRTQKNYGVDLSSEIKIPSLNDFATRKQFNTFKQQASSFTNRFNLNYQYKKNDYGVVATKKQINQIERNTHEAQQLAKNEIKRLKKMPFYNAGKQEGTLGMRQQNVKPSSISGISKVPNFNFNRVRSQEDLETIERKANRKANPTYYNKRYDVMKENYIMRLSATYNSDADPLIERLREMDSRNFYDMYQQYEEFDFKYLPPSDQISQFGNADMANEYINELIMYQEDYLSKNHDLRDF